MGGGGRRLRGRRRHVRGRCRQALPPALLEVLRARRRQLCGVPGGGHAGLVLPRSGLALRHGIALVNAPGLIDAGYRGEVRVDAGVQRRERLGDFVKERNGFITINDSMTYRRCGRSGLKLPAVSLGFWHNFGDDVALVGDVSGSPNALARIVRVLCAVAGRCRSPVVAAVAVTVAVSSAQVVRGQADPDPQGLSVPEDRKREGLMMQMSVLENSTLGALSTASRTVPAARGRCWC